MICEVQVWHQPGIFHGKSYFTAQGSVVVTIPGSLQETAEYSTQCKVLVGKVLISQRLCSMNSKLNYSVILLFVLILRVQWGVFIPLFLHFIRMELCPTQRIILMCTIGPMVTVSCAWSCLCTSLHRCILKRWRPVLLIFLVV